MDMAGTYCWLRLPALVVGPGCWSMSLTHVIGEGPRFLDQFFDQVVSLGSWLLAHFLGPGKLSRRCIL